VGDTLNFPLPSPPGQGKGEKGKRRRDYFPPLLPDRRGEKKRKDAVRDGAFPSLSLRTTRNYRR